MAGAESTATHHEAGVRERLMNAAVALFARKGYAATTVREIVAAAGVTKPVLYYHFGSKEGIFLEMMGRALREFEATAADALRAPGSVRARLGGFLDRMHALMLQHVDEMRVLDAIYYGPPQGAPFFDYEALHTRFIEIVSGLVREGIAAGEFRAGDADDIAWAIVGPFEVVRGMSLSHPEMDFGRERLAGLLSVVFEGVCVREKKESVR
jgi:AcrR family transcriptional regulator